MVGCFPSFVPANCALLSPIINAQSYESSNNFENSLYLWHLNPFTCKAFTYLNTLCFKHYLPLSHLRFYEISLQTWLAILFHLLRYFLKRVPDIFKHLLLDTFKQNKASQLIALFYYKFHLQVSYSSASPKFASQLTYPNTYQAVPSLTSYSKAKVAFIKHYGWKRVAILYEYDPELFSPVIFLDFVKIYLTNIT